MANTLRRVRSPALRPGSPDYNRAVYDQNNNILRLFFERVVNMLSGLTSINDNGGKFLYMPYGRFYDTTTQTLANADTAQAVTFDTSELSNGVSIVSSSRITATDAGMYWFLFSGEIDKTNASTDSVYIWYRKNGTDIARSSHQFSVKGSDAESSLAVTTMVDLNAGDYIEVMWASPDTTIELTPQSASAPYPAVPSAAVVVAYASNG